MWPVAEQPTKPSLRAAGRPPLEWNLLEPHEGQATVLDCPARFRVLACGRRWGKSTLALHAVAAAAEQPGARIWYVAPTFRMVDLHWRNLKRALPHGFAGEVSETDRRIVCPNGAEIDFRSAANPDHLRGAGLHFLVVDEAAFIPDGGAVWAEALRPTLTDQRGAALIISTPRGRDWFHAIWLRGQRGDLDEIASFRYPTASAGHIAPAEIEAVRRELPEHIFRQEYEAAFLHDGGSVFRRVAEAIEPLPEAPYDGHFVVGVDWAKHEDFTVFCVLDASAGRVVELERFQQIDYAVQTQRLKACAARWRPQVILAEQNSIGEPLLETLQRDGLPALGFVTTARSKQRIIEQLAAAFDHRAIRIADDPVLRAELEAYSLERTATGTLRYGAPAGHHDDLVMALALAWEARAKSPADAAAAWL